MAFSPECTAGAATYSAAAGKILSFHVHARFLADVIKRAGLFSKPVSPIP
jgi:hypothetical protein